MKNAKAKKKSRAGEPLKIRLEAMWMHVLESDVKDRGVIVKIAGWTSSGRKVEISVDRDEYGLRNNIGTLRGAMACMVTKAMARARMIEGWMNHSTPPEVPTT